MMPLKYCTNWALTSISRPPRHCDYRRSSARRIQKVGEQYSGIIKNIETWNSELDGLAPLIDGNAKKSPTCRTFKKLGQLSTAVHDTLKLGDTEEELSIARNECDSLFDRISTALKRLPLWSGSVEDVESLLVPLSETIDRFDDELASLENEKRELDRQSKVCQREVGELNEKLEALRLEFDLPTEADLQSVRQRREQGWQLIRRHC